MSTKNKKRVDLARWGYSDGSFDLVDGVAIVLAPLLIVLVLLVGLFGGPESKPLTLSDWSRAAPTDFLLTTAKELAGMPGNGSSGPPYNHLRQGEHLGPLQLQRWGGLGLPIDPAKTFVIAPLQEVQDRNTYAVIGSKAQLDSQDQSSAIDQFVKRQNEEIGAALRRWNQVDFELRRIWATHYINALEIGAKHQPAEADKLFGPVQTLAQELLYLAQAGILDGLLTAGTTPYASDYTLSTLFIGDGEYFKKLTVTEGLNTNRMAISGGTNAFPG